MAENASVPWGSTDLYAILATTVVAVTGLPLVGPILPTIVERFGVSDVQAGLVLTVYSLPIIVLAPILGIYSDRLGRKQVLIPCLIVFGFAGGFITLVSDFSHLLVLRFVQGAAGSGLLTVSLTLVGDIFEGPRRNAVMGVNSVAIATGAIIAPILSGWLVTRAWNAPFLIYFSAVGVAIAIWILLDDPDVRNESTGMTYVRGAISEVSLVHAVVLYGAVFAMYGLLYGGVHTAVPFLLDRSFGLSSARIGVVVALAPAAMSIPAFQSGRLARRMSNVTVIAAGLILITVSALLFGLIVSWLVVALGAIVYGLGKGVTQPALDTAISDLVSPRYRGAAMSLRTTTKNISAALWPIALTTAGSTIGYPTAFLLCSLGLVGVVGAVLEYYR